MHTYVPYTRSSQMHFFCTAGQPLELSQLHSPNPTPCSLRFLIFTLISFCFCRTKEQERRQSYLLAQDTLALIGNRRQNARSLEPFSWDPGQTDSAQRQPAAPASCRWQLAPPSVRVRPEVHLILSLWTHRVKSGEWVTSPSPKLLFSPSNWHKASLISTVDLQQLAWADQ
jgi:hypothetical protein